MIIMNCIFVFVIIFYKVLIVCFWLIDVLFLNGNGSVFGFSYLYVFFFVIFKMEYFEKGYVYLVFIIIL